MPVPEWMAADNDFLFETEGEPCDILRRATGLTEEGITVIIERGALARDQDIRDYANASRLTGTAQIRRSEYAGPAYQDVITDADGVKWTILKIRSIEAGVYEVSIEHDARAKL